MITKPKGTYDLVGKEAQVYKRLERVIDAYMRLYNYNYLRTPVFENSELYKRSVGDSSDIVQKETYDFTDRSERKLTLRPEGTAGAIRYAIENKIYGDGNILNKLYYMGTMYRYERPGLGRFREFTQFGVESLGSDSPYMDAEVISLAVNILREVGIDTTVYINNLGTPEERKNYSAALKEYIKPYLNDLCEDCNNRFETNPLRILDCKVDCDKEIFKNIPKISDFLSKESQERFNKLLEVLSYLDIDYEIDENLVRGLDYYDYMVFELKTDSDSLTICGGGRYNHLANELDGPEIPCVGFGMGVERVISILLENDDEKYQNDVYILAVNEEERLKASLIMQDLRLNDIICDTDYMNKSLKSQFKDADRLNSKFLIILNSEDLQKGLVNIKDNVTKEEVKIPEDEIIDYILGVI